MMEKKLNFMKVDMHTESTNIFKRIWGKIRGIEITYPMYVMSSRERKLWKSIEQKAKEGYDEWYHSKYNSEDYYCPPWTKPLTRAEELVLNHIHKKIYGSHWYITDPLGWTQCNYISYEDCKNRVI